MIGIKDLNSINLYCSQAFINALGVRDIDIIGKTFCTSPILEGVIAEDQQLFKTCKLHAFLKINKFHDYKAINIH